MQDFETVADALAVGRVLLSNIGIKSAALDTRLLLGEVTQLDAAGLLLSPDRKLSGVERNLYIDLMVRRAEGEPVSRIVGVREFYGREFKISRAVLDPRPDTETLVDLVLSRHGTATTKRVIDLGCGSGAIIITLLAEKPTWTGLAVDLSAEAVIVTTRNADSLQIGARIDTAIGSWFEGCAERFDLVVSNPPYIPRRDIVGLAREVREHDPQLALDGGTDGLDCYRAIAAQAANHLLPGGEVVLEIGAGQRDEVVAIFVRQGFGLVEYRDDLGGHVRALAFSRA